MRAGIMTDNMRTIPDMPGGVVPACQLCHSPESERRGDQLGGAGGAGCGVVTASRRRASDLKVSLRMLAGQ